MEEYKDNSRFFLNTAGISLVEFLWGLGLPLVFESTFLQLFLAKLGATNFLIGFIPAFLFAGQAFLGIVSAYQSRNISRKRTLVIVYHLFPAVTVLFFGIYLLITATFLPSTIVVFFIAYILFNAGIGLTMPVWQNFLVKLFNLKQVFPAFSVMMTFQSIGRLLSSFLIAGYFTNREITALTSSKLFIFCGSVFFTGAFAFLLTKEPDTLTEKDSTSTGFFRYSAESLKRVVRNKNVLLFLLSDLEMYAVVAVISFYANYAVECFGISPAAAAGVFVGLNYAGQISANVAFGTFNLLNIKTKCFFARICSITGIILLIFAAGLPYFLVASVLFGLSRAIRSLVYAPAVKHISGRTDVTDYFATAPIVMLPASIGISLLSGKLLDIMPMSTGAAYRTVFAALGLISFISLFFIRRIDFSTRDSAAAE